MKRYIVLLFLGILGSLTVQSCVESNEGQREVTEEEIADTKFVYKKNTDWVYVKFFDEFWSDNEVDMLSRIPEGIIVRSECSDCSDYDAFKSILVKLLVKQIAIEKKVDSYAQFKDTLERTLLFEYDKSSENSVRAAEFLNANFSESERYWLQSMPYGLSAEMTSEDDDLDCIYGLFAKLLVKSATVDRKLDSLVTSPTIAIEPVAFIREYLKTHSLDSIPWE